MTPEAYRDKMIGLLTRFDEKELREHAASIGLVASSDEVFWIGWHKARTAMPGIASKLRQQSRKWLLAKGYEPLG